MTLLANLGADPGYQLALDSTYVYTVLNGSGNVAKVARIGGTVTPLGAAAGNAQGVAVDATNIYWVTTNGTSGQLSYVAKTGGSTTTLTSTLINATSVAVDGTNVYWSEGRPSHNGTIRQMPKLGGTVHFLVTIENMQNGTLSVYASNIYWSNYGGDYALKQIPIGGGTVTTLVPAFTGIAPANLFCSSPVSDGTTVYFLNGTNPGSVHSIPVGGGAIQTLASNQNIPSALALFAGTLFWTNQGDNTVRSVSTAGGPVTTLATVPGLPGATELGGIAADGGGIYWAGIASQDIYVDIPPITSTITADSSMTADMGLVLGAQAPLIADSGFQLIVTNPVAMTQDVANEKMYVLDLDGPKILVFDTTSVNGTTPPLQFPTQTIAPIDLSGAVPDSSLLLKKILFDPITSSLWLAYNVMVGPSVAPRFVKFVVSPAGAFIGETLGPVAVGGAVSDFTLTVDPTGPTGYVYFASSVTYHEVSQMNTDGTYITVFDYQNGVLPAGSEILFLDVADTNNNLSVVVSFPVSGTFCFGYLQTPPAIPSGVGWASTPQFFAQALDGVVGLSQIFTTELRSSFGPWASVFNGGPPTAVEDNGAFNGTGGFGANPAAVSFPGFLGPQLQMCVVDTTGVLYTSQDPQFGGFSSLTTFPDPATNLLGVVNPDTTYPSNDQYGIWALAPQLGGLAHLYRYSFVSGTLVDLPFPLPPVTSNAAIVADSSFTATMLQDNVNAALTTDSFLLAIASVSSQAFATADSTISADLTQQHSTGASFTADSSILAFTNYDEVASLFGDSSISSGRAQGGLDGGVTAQLLLTQSGTLNHNEAFNNFNFLFGPGDFILSGAKARATQIHILSGPNAGFYPILFVDSATKLHINAALSHPGAVNYVLTNFHFFAASAHFITNGVTTSHVLVIHRPDTNAGIYPIASVDSETQLTLAVLSGGDPMANIPESGIAYDILLPLYMSLTVQGSASPTGGNSNFTGSVGQAASGVQASPITFIKAGNALPVAPTAKAAVGPSVKYQIKPPTRGG